MSAHGQARPIDPSAPRGTGEFAFSMADFRTIATFVKSESGIDIDEAKATLVYARLTKRLRALSLTTFQAYCAHVETDAAERQRMLSALTTNTTRFFREPHHFNDLKNKVLPPLLADARQGGRLRIWSAASSRGQEPYSIALTVLGAMPEAASHDVRILATDINPEVLAHGRRGIYDKREVGEVPAELRRRWFGPDPGGDPGLTCVSDGAKALVSFRELNLIGRWPMRGPFDAIFCRNVVIYFDRETQVRLWQRLVQLLEPGGTLYIGHSERISGPASGVLMSAGTTTYRKSREVRR